MMEENNFSKVYYYFIYQPVLPFVNPKKYFFLGYEISDNLWEAIIKKLSVFNLCYSSTVRVQWQCDCAMNKIDRQKKPELSYY